MSHRRRAAAPPWPRTLRRPRRIRNNLLFTWCNIKERAELERQTARGLLHKVAVRLSLTDEERQQHQRWERMTERLNYTLVVLQDMLFLFRFA